MSKPTLVEELREQAVNWDGFGKTLPPRKLETAAADRIDELEAECTQFSKTWDKQQAEIRRLNAVLDTEKDKITALKNRLDNGIKYDETLNVYTVRWTKMELEQAALQANEIYEKIHWSDARTRGESDEKE